MYPVNILHIISKIPVGGVENQLLLVLKNYDKNRFFPIVCSLTDKGEIGERVEELGIEVICLNKLKHRFDWSIARDLYNLIKQKNIKIVRTHQYHANLYGRLAARLAKVPCIIPSVHNVYTRDNKFHRRLINRLLARFSDRIVAVSETVKRDIVKYDGVPDDKVVVIYNGIDKDKFIGVDEKAVRLEFGISDETIVIGTIGRITLQKGQTHLIEAISRLKNNFPNIVLLLVGDGILKHELETYAEKLGVKENIIFTGNRFDIPELLAAMDIFVLPSLWEGLGTALIEAMAAGKPVIAADIPPFREIVNSDKVGIIVPPGNSCAVADSIELLLHNKALAVSHGEEAKKRVFSSFKIEDTVNRYTSIFEDILKGKGYLTNG